MNIKLKTNIRFVFLLLSLAVIIFNWYIHKNISCTLNWDEKIRCQVQFTNLVYVFNMTYQRVPKWGPTQVVRTLCRITKMIWMFDKG